MGAYTEKFLLAYDFIVFSGGDQIHDHIKYGKCQEGQYRTDHQQTYILKSETANQDFFYQMEGKTAMDAGCCKRQKEYHQYLAADGCVDLPSLHTDLFEDCKAFFVFIAFGYLFVIDDQDSCHDKEQSQEDSQEKQSAVQAVEFGPAFRPGFDSIEKGVRCIFLLSQISIQTFSSFWIFLPKDPRQSCIRISPEMHGLRKLLC